MEKKVGVTLEPCVIGMPWGNRRGHGDCAVWVLDSQEAAYGPCLGPQLGGKIGTWQSLQPKYPFWQWDLKIQAATCFLSSDYKKPVLWDHSYYLQQSTFFKGNCLLIFIFLPASRVGRTSWGPSAGCIIEKQVWKWPEKPFQEKVLTPTHTHIHHRQVHTHNTCSATDVYFDIELQVWTNPTDCTFLKPQPKTRLYKYERRTQSPKGVISCLHKYTYACTQIHTNAYSSVCRHRATYSHKYILHTCTDPEKHADMYICHPDDVFADP